jgi:UDP-N-acetylmuramoylalanine--D-glutamate ligase
VAAALALRARGKDVIGVDAGAGAGAGVLADAGVELHLHEEGVALLERVNAVVKSPGVPVQTRVIAAAHERGLPVLGELELAWRMLRNEFIAVTGTNGKTTTVELIGHIHREAGLQSAVAGNVGRPASSLVGAVSPGATVVCEASSFQLEDTREFAPEVAVLLNVSQDHLDRHQTMAAYLAAKLEIFARQDSEDIAVVPTDLCTGVAKREVSATIEGLRARRVCFGAGAESALEERSGELWWEGHPLLAVSELRLRGRHNVENAMAAAAACLARGIDLDSVRLGLRSFPGVPHRLEEMGRRRGVLYVNDSKATNVASTLVALSAFADGATDVRGRASAERAPDGGQPTRSGSVRPGPKAVHLIMGGQGKGQDFTVLAEAIERSCAGVYLIGEDASLIARALRGTETQLRTCRDLERAVVEASQAAAPGEVVLLSPACASFDQFANFEARGERFRELLRGYRSRGGG